MDYTVINVGAMGMTVLLILTLVFVIYRKRTRKP